MYVSYWHYYKTVVWFSSALQEGIQVNDAISYICVHYVHNLSALWLHISGVEIASAYI